MKFYKNAAYTFNGWFFEKLRWSRIYWHSKRLMWRKYVNDFVCRCAFEFFHYEKCGWKKCGWERYQEERWYDRNHKIQILQKIKTNKFLNFYRFFYTKWINQSLRIRLVLFDKSMNSQISCVSEHFLTILDEASMAFIFVVWLNSLFITWNSINDQHKP